MKKPLSQSIRCFRIWLPVFLTVGMLSCTKTTQVIDLPGTWVSQYTLDKSIVEVNTTNVATGFETVFQSMISDSSQRAHFCQAFVEPVRFFNDKSGYFYLESYRAWMVAHATKPNLIGTYRMDVQDANGKFYVKEMVNTVIYIGYGFVEYYFENPATGTTERKLGFVKSIPAAEFFIGSGFYGDPPDVYYEVSEAMLAVAEEATTTMAQGIGGVFASYYADTNDRVTFCRKMIDYIRFFDDQSGYFFIYDFNCVNVAHGIQKNLQGQNLYDYQDSRGNYVIRELVALAKSPTGEGYYEYWWNNPVSGQEEPKLAYVMKIPGIDYFIGSGIYLK
ncbi:MAG: cache domain-containing protein [Bacteroidia bacterium]|nr:cache domain-containing protein [Bacteroidia bacterium]